MNRVDRLLLKAEEMNAHSSYKGSLTMGVLTESSLNEEPEDSPYYNTWELVANISGTPGAKPDTITSYFSTKAEALAEWERLEREYPPPKNGKEAVLLVMDGENKLQ